MSEEGRWEGREQDPETSGPRGRRQKDHRGFQLLSSREGQVLRRWGAEEKMATVSQTRFLTQVSGLFPHDVCDVPRLTAYLSVENVKQSCFLFWCTEEGWGLEDWRGGSGQKEEGRCGLGDAGTVAARWACGARTQGSLASWN